MGEHVWIGKRGVLATRKNPVQDAFSDVARTYKESKPVSIYVSFNLTLVAHVYCRLACILSLQTLWSSQFSKKFRPRDRRRDCLPQPKHCYRHPTSGAIRAGNQRQMRAKKGRRLFMSSGSKFHFGPMYLHPSWPYSMRPGQVVSSPAVLAGPFPH
jgi:hypothetical protein